MVGVVDKLPLHMEEFSSTTGRVIYSHKAICTCFVAGFKFPYIFSTGHFTGFFVVTVWSLYFVLSTYFLPQKTDSCIAAGTLKGPSLSSN